MSGDAPGLRVADRSALIALCALLVLSVLIRVHSSWDTATEPGTSAAAERVPLGDGVFLPHADAVQSAVWIATCNAPVNVDFIDPAPHGADSSLASPQNPS